MGKKVKWVITSNINKSYCQHLKNLSGKLPRLHRENLVDKKFFLQSIYSHPSIRDRVHRSGMLLYLHLKRI